MPLEALALLLDSVGLGAPVWWLCGQALNGLIGLAHFVSTRPGAVTMLPTMPVMAFGLLLLGGLWICLWREKWRYLGLIPALIGTLLVATNRARISILPAMAVMSVSAMTGEIWPCCAPAAAISSAT
jgi:competence protein ComEC